ncbi:hypothetical protein [Adhaeretor mobilis]|uniref:Uncharacterized protein n=1 Tax=Adhaeretor mobilis TaxID=1930276 RepID=A0A517MZ66_9BACT|nr:hypothetical protein [Adhaeretor mobilis]QDT00186.1 hypothetical protein HG15A2_35210 [Adhaeretor mobilis]
MQLPSLKVSIPVIFIAWCVAGVMLRGPVMLAYPAMWLGVAALFGVLHVMLKQDDEESSQTVTVTDTPGSTDSKLSDERVSAAV